MRCFRQEMRRLTLFLALIAVLAAPAAALGQSSADTALQRTLTKTMRGAGPASGAYVLDATDRRTLFQWNADTPRILASNTKLFTATATLDQLGVTATLPTVVLGDGQQLPDGTWSGDLYVRGGGDPTFGSAGFVKRNYRQGAAADDLADQLERAGITGVTGRVYGDESRFDSLRGGPDSGWGTSIWVGPISALSYNRGLGSETGSSFQVNPPAFAAARLDELLEARDIRVRGKPAAAVAPAGARQLAEVQSPPVEELVRRMLKRIGETPGTTRGGAGAAVRHAASLGALALLVDGSGLSRANAASPRSVGRLLDAMIPRAEFAAFERALPIAGKDGTLHDRMRSGPARGRCRAKTGTLSDVSALSGYCRSRSGDTIVFSFLMNRVYTAGARKLQDRMAQALARYTG